jgi:hypothetical protein
MRNGLLGSIAVLMVGAGLALAQPPAPGAVEPLPVAPVPGEGGFQALLPSGLQMPPDDTDYGLRAQRAWTSFEYLLYFINSMPTNTQLVSVGTPVGGGILGTPAGTVLYPGQNLRFNPISGGRVRFGSWLPSNPIRGWEVTATILETKNDRFQAGFGPQVVARPVIDANAGVPGALIVASPGFATGGVFVDTSSFNWTLEANSLRRLYVDERRQISLTFGSRYFELNEELWVRQTSSFLPGSVVSFYGALLAAPNRIDVEDNFDTKNQYLATQIGLRGQYHYRRWAFEWGTKFGIGPNYQTLDIKGVSRLILAPGGAANEVPGGLLAATSNIGRTHRYVYAGSIDSQVKVGYRMLRNTDVLFGYNFFWINNVIRPGTEIDPQVNGQYVPTSAIYGLGPILTPNPIRNFNQTDFWMMGLSVALQVQY